MELKYKIDIQGFYLAAVLKVITLVEFKEEDYDFLYGVDEYAADYKKIKKQFKRLWR